MTREDWLLRAIDAMRQRFADVGAALPAVVHASVGFPSVRATSQRRRVIGQCWHGSASADGNAHVLISPLLGDPVAVLDVLMHELVHVVTPGQGHRAGFVKVCRSLGLTEGPATSQAAGPELRADLARLASALGAYPHAALSAKALERTKQSTRLLKVECPKCGYVARVTRKWLDEAGAPICPAHLCGMEIAA